MMNSILSFLTPKKSKKKRLSYEDYIIHNAPDNASFSITRVNNIEIVRTFPLEEILYAQIAALIRQGDIKTVQALAIDNNLLEDLTLVTFTSQTAEPFAAIIYDSYEVWQEPVVVEVFKLG